MPDRLKGRGLTKSDSLALQVGGLAQGQQPCPVKKKNIMLRKQSTVTTTAKINQSLTCFHKVKGVFNLAVTQLLICQIIFTFVAINLSRHCGQSGRVFV